MLSQNTLYNQWSEGAGGPGGTRREEREETGMTQQMTAANRAVTAQRVTEADHYRAPVLSVF